MEASPLDLLITKEDKGYVETALATVDPEERRVLDAFANSKSGRSAARKLGMPESTYRKRLYEIISKIQPNS
jgi:hypothetical protein